MPDKDDLIDCDRAAPADPALSDPAIGVVITTFASENIIEGCLGSLFDYRADIAKVVITDNASADRTCDVIRDWAAAHKVSFTEAVVGETPSTNSWLTLLRSPINGGFAYATNRGIELLLDDPEIELLWLVNPDCLVMSDAAALYRRAGRDQNFSLMGGRTVFVDRRDTVQTDGGTVSLWTGVCKAVNWDKPISSATFPEAASLDFITGANCVASRRFIEKVGLMKEDFFLYYEEVDWAFRRGDLPLRVVPEAVVHHYGGTAIGSGSIGRRSSPFSNYFTFRNRIKFILRYRSGALPVALMYGLAKAAQLLLIGAVPEARAVLMGILGLAPPSDVLSVLQPEARALVLKTMRS